MNQKQTNSAEKPTVTQDLTGSRLVKNRKSLSLLEKEYTVLKISWSALI